MAYLNEVSAATVTEWLNNFDNYENNIFKPFQDNQILLNRTVYNALSNNNLYHMHIYFGLDNNNNPKLLIVGAYELDSYDSDESGYVDVIGDGLVYELYSGNSISVAQAQTYVDNWVNTNSANGIFIKSALLPRPNFIKFFIEDGEEQVNIFFGLDNNNKLKVMQKEPVSGDLVLNKTFPCPDKCPQNGL